MRTPANLLRAALLAAVLTACESPAGPGDAPVPLLTTLPRPLSSSEQVVVRGANAFALSLLRQVNEGHLADNVVLSPLSVSFSVAMAANGASGATFDAIRTTLGFATLDTAQFRTAYRDLLTLVRGLDPQVTTTIANSVWYSPGQITPTPQFLQSSRDYFNAEIRPLDFRLPTAADSINGWVSRATQGMIPTIIERTNDDVMALVNAIFFKARWRHGFDVGETSPRPFFDQSGASRQVPTMSAKIPVRLTRVARATAGELLYGNGAYGLVVLLPDGDQPSWVGDVNALVRRLTPASLDTLSLALRDTGTQQLVVTFPKLDLNFGDELGGALGALGMSRAMSGFAEFDRIDPQSRMAISRVEHKTKLVIDEVGTTAAAVTYTGIVPVSAPPAMIVNRPFVLLLRERLTGTVLFAAKITKVP